LATCAHCIGIGVAVLLEKIGLFQQKFNLKHVGTVQGNVVVLVMSWVHAGAKQQEESYCANCCVVSYTILMYSGADKSLARPGRNQAIFPAIYATSRPITTFTTAHHVSLP